jgi:hypothetical protein
MNRAKRRSGRRRLAPTIGTVSLRRATTARLLGAAAVLVGLAALIAASAFAAPPAQFGGPEGEGAGQFIEPVGIAVDRQSGNSYLADRGNHRIAKFGPDGEFLLAWGWGVADGTTPALQTCGPESAAARCFAGLAGPGAGELGRPQGVAVDNDPASASFHDVYVIDDENLRVEKFGPGGDFLLTFGGEVNETKVAEREAEEAASEPVTVTPAEENLCAAGSGDECGAGLQGGGSGSFEGFEGTPIAIGPTGTVYVGDRERVQEFSSSGAFEEEITIAGGSFLHALAVDSTGDLYLTDEAVGGVHKYSPAGVELGEPRDPGAGAFQTSIAIGPADQLFSFDAEAEAIDAFGAGGDKLSTLTEPGGGGSGGDGLAYVDTAASLFVVHSEFVHVVVSPTPGTPLVLPGSTQAAEILPTTATLRATLNPEGGEETTYSFQYGTSTTYGETVPIPPAELSGGPFEDQAVAAVISGLSADTIYHFRVLATNKAGKNTAGPDQSFETLPPVSILSTSVGAVTSTSATLEAELDPHGLATTYQFQYGLSSGYGSSAPTAEASAGQGSGPAPVTAIVQGLAPDTTYHYRVIARNSLGPSVGPDREFTTQGALATVLPDGRGWELVSPAEKNGIPLEANGFEGGVDQAAAGGGGFAYTAKGALGSNPAGTRSFLLSQYLARRGPSGWTSEDVTTPHQAVAGGVAGRSAEYKFYSAELSLGAVEPEGATPLSPSTSERTPYLRNSAGEFIPLANEGNVAPGVTFGGTEVEGQPELWIGGVELVAVTPDLDHIVLHSGESLIPGLPAGDEYVWSAGALAPFSEIPPLGGTVCGGPGPACVPTASEGETAALGLGDTQTRDAVSRGGSRLVFETEPAHHLFLRDQGRGETVRLDALAPGAKGGGGAPIFQDANANGSKVFFTDTSRLTADSTARSGAPDLYVCEISQAAPLACELKDLSVDPHPGRHAQVQGFIPGVGGEGRFVYFVANGALAEGAVDGSCAEKEPLEAGAGELCNLYSYDTETATTRLVAVISGFDSPDWASRIGAPGVLSRLTARVSPDGRWLAFMSRRPLTGYDNRDATSAVPDEEVFLYHQPEGSSGPGSLTCASCDPTGGRPHGVVQADEHSPRLLVDQAENWVGQPLAGSIPGWIKHSNGAAGYQARYLGDSGRLFFDASDPLVPQDSNATEDAYEFEPVAVGGCSSQSPGYQARLGSCTDLISAGTSPEESAFLDASESGDDAFFITASRLAPTDVDHALDIYDARVGGAAQVVATAAECAGDACQVPATPPDHPTPGTVLLDGPGNVVACPKGKVKKAGRCVRKQHKKHKKKHHKKSNKQQKKAKKSKRATENRGGVS